jgi:PAS domain S-box-containing protein
MPAVSLIWPGITLALVLLLAVATIAHVRQRRRLIDEAHGRFAAIGALKESQDRLEEFAAGAADWLWEIDAEYRFTMDTGRMLRGGLVGADLIGLRRWEMPGVDPRDPIWDRYRAMLDAREAFRNFEFSYAGQNGRRFHASITGHPLYKPDGTFIGYRGTARDITAEVETKAQAGRTAALLDAVRSIQSSYIGVTDPKNAYKQMLATLLELTQSAYGFVGDIRRDEHGRPYLKAHAITNIAWNEETRRLYAEQAAQGLEFRNLDTLFGAAITSGKPMISNDPKSDVRGGSRPQGHPPLDCFLGVPLYSGQDMVGMMGVANRPGGYDDAIVAFLEPLMGACGAVIGAIQADAQQAAVDAELRASQQRLDLALDSTGIRLWDWNLASGDFKFDTRMLERMGYAAGEVALTIDAWDALMHPDDLVALLAAFSDHNEGRTDLLQAIYRIRAKSGDWRWILTRGRIVQRGSDGTPLRMSGTHLEITDLKQTELALRRSDQRFRALAESSRAIPWEADVATYRITYVGARIEAVVGYSASEWVEKDLWPQRLHPDDREHVLREAAEYARAGVDHNLEYRLIATDGRVVWIRDLVSVIKSDDGQVWLYGAMVDVTEQKQSEEALRENEARYRQAERVAGLIHWSSVGAEDGSWQNVKLAFSDTAASFFGLPPESLPATTAEFVDMVVHPDDRERLRQGFTSVTQGKTEEFTLEYRIQRQDGSVAAVSEIGRRRLSEDGRLQTAFGTIQDITERKHTENALRGARVEAEIANQAKSQFLANVSHELRTPLNAIIGFSEIMTGELMGPLGSSLYKEYANDIHESGRHLLAIINDILDLSRVEAGQTALNESSVEMQKLVAACLILVRGKAHEGGLTISVEAIGTVFDVVADERLLKQALLNLLSNAIKFTPKGGSIRIVTRTTPAGVEIAVADSGIGMTENELAQVAKPFVQLENWLVRKYEGTGLGLSIAKSFCELHSGWLQIVSAPGRGTTAIIHLPASRIIPADKARAHAQ